MFSPRFPSGWISRWAPTGPPPPGFRRGARYLASPSGRGGAGVFGGMDWAGRCAKSCLQWRRGDRPTDGGSVRAGGRIDRACCLMGYVANSGFEISKARQVARRGAHMRE